LLYAWATLHPEAQMNRMSKHEALLIGLTLATLIGLNQLLTGCVPPADDEIVPLDASDSVLGSDGIGPAGPPDSSYTETTVWEITAQWSDTDSAAGLAWQANSSLDWEQKYSLWVDSMVGIEAEAGYYDTFQITTPEGKVLPSPSLECAEMAYFLRVVFAAWYGLPFFVEGTSGGDRVFAGHFGFINKDGSRWSGMPKFGHYDDYSDVTDEQLASQGWPSDSTLRAKAIPGNATDDQSFLDDDAHFGWYMDELMLNKRVGYFMLMLLPYFGSINLADENNAFHVKADELMPGDVLLKRWQSQGIGHVMIVKEVQWIEGGSAVAELVSGSMPRRQAKWESSVASKNLFTNDWCGGPGYEQLGGGLKAFNQAEVRGGYWHNRVPADRFGDWIPWSDSEARAERPELFESLLASVSAEELAAELVLIIEDKRNHLRNYPASCSARISREQTFDQLYDLAGREWGWSHERVDEEYRILEDYVFAELSYDESKTCCWNSTTSEMHAIVMDYNHSIQDADPDTCVDPVVFKAEDGGYDVFADYAASTGRADQWVPWSEDESCPQRDTVDDVEADHVWASWCDVADEVGDGDETGDGNDDETGDDDSEADAYEPNDSAGAAAVLVEGSYEGLTITSSDADWFRVEAGGAEVTATLSFSHDDGDLDLKVEDGDGSSLGSSTSTSDSESVTASADAVLIHVYGYSGATNGYTLTITVD